MNDDQRIPPAHVDTNPQETCEWLDSLEYVLQTSGVERAMYLFERLRDRLAEWGAPTSGPCNTPCPSPGTRTRPARIIA